MAVVSRRTSLLGAVALGVLVHLASAGCISVGVDYTNGGSYALDATSYDFFSFGNQFAGCKNATLSPALESPNGDFYACTDVSTVPELETQTSACGIPIAYMVPGTWNILIEGDEVRTKRSFNISFGKQQTVYVTAIPTVTITMNDPAATIHVSTTSTRNVTYLAAGPTINSTCSTPTQTLTTFELAPTTTIRISTTLNMPSRTVTAVAVSTTSITGWCYWANPEDKKKLRRDGSLIKRVVPVPATIFSTVYDSDTTATETSTVSVPLTTTTDTVRVFSTTTTSLPAQTVCVLASTTVRVTKTLPASTTFTTSQTATVTVGGTLTSTRQSIVTRTITDTSSYRFCTDDYGEYGIWTTTQ